MWLLTRERELKEDLRRQRDKEIELAIFTLEEETSKDKAECERAADNRCVSVCTSTQRRWSLFKMMSSHVWKRKSKFIRCKC